MSGAPQLAFVVASLLILIALLHTVNVVGTRDAWSMEARRKSVHVAAGLYALSFPLTFQDTWPVLALAGAAMMLLLGLRLPRLARTDLRSALHGIDRVSYGELFFALSVGLIFFIADGDLVLFVVPIAIVTLADAAAALIGIRHGRNRFIAGNGAKSLEGVATFFFVSLILAVVLLAGLTDIAWPSLILLSVAIASLGAVVEACAWHGFDNLLVPLAIHLFLADHLDGTPLRLFLLSVGFIAILLSVIRVAVQFGLSKQAAAAVAVLLLLIGIGADPSLVVSMPSSSGALTPSCPMPLGQHMIGPEPCNTNG